MARGRLLGDEQWAAVFALVAAILKWNTRYLQARSTRSPPGAPRSRLT